MALSDEQRAMLQLLLEGGQGYDDIGSLLGIAPDEVRSRTRDALKEMGGADPDAQVALTDYLVGQADPIGRADAVRHLQSDPEANALAQRLVTQLRLLAPKAELPEIPAPKGGRRAPAPPPPPPPAVAPEAPPPEAAPAAPSAPVGPKGPGFASRVAGFFSGLGGGGKRRTQLIVAGVAALALAVAVVVVASSSDDGEQSAEDCPTVDTSQAEQAGLPTIPLEATEEEPEGECAPSGQLTLVASKKQLGIQINAVGLEPTAQDEAYIVWLFQSDQQSLPVAAQPSPDGNLTTTSPVAQELATLIASGVFASVRVSRASQSEAQTVAQSIGQGKQRSPTVPFFGTTVLEGALPQPQQGQAGGGQAPQGQGEQQGQAPQQGAQGADGSQ